MARKKLQDTPPDKRPGVRLNKIGDARRLLQRVINLLLNNEIETGTGRAVIYATSVLLSCFEVEKLELIEERISELEKQHDKIPDTTNPFREN